MRIENSGKEKERIDILYSNSDSSKTSNLSSNSKLGLESEDLGGNKGVMLEAEQRKIDLGL